MIGVQELDNIPIEQNQQADAVENRFCSYFQRAKTCFYDLKARYTNIQPILVSSSNFFSYTTIARVYDRVIDGASALFSLTVSRKSHWTSKIPMIIKIFSVVTLGISFISAIMDFKRCLTGSHKIDYFLRGLENTSDTCSSLVHFLSGMVLAGMHTAKIAAALFSLSLSGAILSIAAVLYQSKQIYDSKNLKNNLKDSTPVDVFNRVIALDKYEIEQRFNIRVNPEVFTEKIIQLKDNAPSQHASITTLLIKRIDNFNTSRSLLILTSLVVFVVMTAMIFSPVGPVALAFLFIAGTIALKNAYSEYYSIKKFHYELNNFSIN